MRGWPKSFAIMRPRGPEVPDKGCGRSAIMVGDGAKGDGMKPMSRRRFLGVSAGAAAGALAGAKGGRAQRSRRPNIVYVFSDQHRRAAMGFLNEDPVITPNFDRFAGGGLHFSNAVSNRPVCSPHRAMLMTGKYPATNNVPGNCNSVWPQNFLRPEERCLSDVLHDAGYDCGFIGKWHLDVPEGPRTGGWEDGNWDAYTPPGPRRHHFNFWYSYGCMFDYMKPHFWTGDDPEDRPMVVDQWEPEHEADVAIRYIRNRGARMRDGAKPFCLFVAPHPPHPPVYPVPEEYLKLYRDRPARELLNRPNLGTVEGGPDSEKGRKAIRKAEEMAPGYFAMVTSVDHEFGRIMQCLKDEGLEEDTIVIFSADHGEMLGSHGRFAKSVFYEESAGIPLIVRWTGKIAPGVEEMPISVPDHMPTLLGLAGLGAMIPGAVEGTDHSALLLGRSNRRAEAALMWHGERPGGLRTATHLFEMWKDKDGKEGYRLFDRRNDPFEMFDVADQSRGLVKELRAEVERLATRFGVRS